MKRILGLDLGTNSIGWALVENDFDRKEGRIIDMGSRIIPMEQSQLTDFERGNSISQTADRTKYRGVRRLYQRDNLRRERLHRVLNILGFLPDHYSNAIDFENRLGQFKKEVKLNYQKTASGKYEFIFKNSFVEMTNDFKNQKIPYDWTLYYLRKKALTEKISKEELAWIILNFNQKRGYYQLRGEEEEVQEGKEKTFEVLRVDKVIDSGDKIKGSNEILYDIYFTNGWKYGKQTTKPENWIDKTKEFIVTTSTTKDGSIKRTFKSVDSEKDWIAIKKKTEQDLDNYTEKNKNHTVGTYIYDKLLENPSQKIRGKLIKTIERKYYKKELEKILDLQIELQPELFTDELYKECITELYPHNDAHRNNIKNNGFKYLFVEDIIFYQRPLKSKKSTIEGCQYETRSYWKTVMDEKTGETTKAFIKNEALKAISKSHPLYQEFRLWQFLKNLKIYKKEAKIDGKTKINYDVTGELLETEEDWVNLFDFLNDKKEIEQKPIIEFFVKQNRINKKDKENYRWNYVEDKKYSANETRATFLSRLKKVKNFNTQKFDYVFIKSLWHIIYSVKDKEQFEKALGKFARKNNLDEDSFVESFKKHPPFKNDYGAYSEKALKKILPLMRRGKYWNEQVIPVEIKNRIESIMERVNALHISENTPDKEIEKALETVVDDDIPRQLVKSFIPFKNRNPYTALNTYQACYAVYNRHSEVSEITRWKTPEDIDKYLDGFKQHSLRNPVVEQVITETLRTVSDIWKEYGDFNEIHLELGREMKNPTEKRKQITKRVTENQNTNERIRLILKELMDDGVEDVKDYSPSHQEILKIYEDGIVSSFDKLPDDIEKIRKNTNPKAADIQRYKLWLEQGYTSPYTGKTIALSRLFTTSYQIEHIIPQSRFFDNSMNNKVICESEVNADKSNKTGYEYMKEKGGSIIDGHKLLTPDEYEAHCKKYFKNNRQKLKNLLSEDIPESFIERQINDTRYISKFVKGLLSNIVRQEGEQQATSNNLVALNGAITSKLKQDWGLNDVWNEIILPRFERLNQLTGKSDFTTQNTHGKTIPNVPNDLKKGFNKKRIDHRHHALDALVIACTTKDHINYITSINTQRKNYSLVAKLRKTKIIQKIDKETGEITEQKKPADFYKPWKNFTVDVKTALETIVISFKQNLRVINRTNNKYWRYVKQNDGSFKKQLVTQNGKNWAIRKPMHKETVSGKLNKKAGKGKIFTAVRTPLNEIKNRKHWNKITDSGIKKILDRHIKNYLDNKGNENFENAFSQEGIEVLNKNIILLNNGKNHQPIYKVRLKEEGVKFPVSDNPISAKNKKYVEAAKGTNLFFAIYKTENKNGEKTRAYETIPFQEVVEHQKWRAGLPKEEQKDIEMIPVKNEKGKFLFSLSPGDLVYVPTNEEMENPSLVNFNNLSKEQVERIYKMVSTTGGECHFVPNKNATEIRKNENGTNSKSERIQDFYNGLCFYDKNNKPVMIKSRCWKLEVNRIGQITEFKR